jgi:hypothetical protein
MARQLRSGTLDSRARRFKNAGKAAPGIREHPQRRRFVVTAPLTIRLEQSEYVIRCPDGTRRQVEDGQPYVVVPSPFEVDAPDELLWLDEASLVAKARAGAWGFFLVSETIVKESSASPATQRRPPMILNGHKQIDRSSRQRAATSAVPG